MVDDGYEPSYEKICFSDISNNFEYTSRLSNHQCEDVFESIALAAHVSCDNGDDTSSWIIDSGSTHHMNGTVNDFLNMALE